MAVAEDCWTGERAPEQLKGEADISAGNDIPGAARTVLCMARRSGLSAMGQVVQE